MRLRYQALLLLLATFALYALTRSLWLDEWDSVQFALGLNEFNLWKHQPHPPGYPLYIFAGRALTHVGLDPVAALTLLGCLSGAVFVTFWFLIARREFGGPFAWLIALATAFTPAVWMIATKAVTDMPAAAALSITAWLAFRRDQPRHLLWAALAGAAAAGLRPQWLAIVLILLLTALIRARAPARSWARVIAAFLLGNLLWLVPTGLSQANAPPARAGALAYPKQLLHQWRWRLDKPNVYIAADGFSAKRVHQRLNQHIKGFAKNGLGLVGKPIRRTVGLLFLACLILTLRLQRRPGFWLPHLPWALALALMAFCFLPEDRRYYMPLTPLLWMILLSGWSTLPRPCSFAVWLAPAAMLYLGLPLALAGHRQPPPPVQMMDYLRTLQPPEKRGRVYLLLDDSMRHAEWYARDFHLRRARAGELDRTMLRRIRAVYTERADLPLTGDLAGYTLEPVATFTRDPAIYPKHSTVQLFQLRKPAR